jgi:CubicO group peptidase (beta-lactamase class C family)
MFLRLLPCLLLASFRSSAGEPLPRRSPAELGISPVAIQAFVEAADREVDTMHSFMILRHGMVAAEAWWAPETPDKAHVLHSLSKSFTSTAVGLAIAEGKLSLDDPVTKFFPGDVPAEPSEHLRAMTVRHLLTMATGHESEPKFVSGRPWTASFLAHPVTKSPGSLFLYNSPATYLCAAIVSKVTGEDLVDYLKPRLFAPLGIDDPAWMHSPEGIATGGWGLQLKTEDIARFGQLYLQKGKWNGQQILPESWAAQATSRQVETAPQMKGDWAEGYGFQFWRCRHGAYRGDGAFGQFCLVLPEHDAVIVMTADTKDMQAQLDLVWKHLLPGFEKDPLPPAPEAEEALRKQLASLRVSPDHVPNQIQLPGTAARSKP